MVYRIYVEKKKEFALEAAGFLSEIREFLGIKGLRSVRMLNRYDVEHIDAALLERCKTAVFSEPPVDTVTGELPKDADGVFAVEFLPGQFDQRADSAAQCIQILSCEDRPTVRHARVWLLYGDLSPSEIQRIKDHVINPVESREASLEPCSTLERVYEAPAPVAILDGFCALEEEGLEQFLQSYGLAMDLEDLRMCRDYFRKENRDPSLTEIRVLDTYWSDHCRHTTFHTAIDKAEFADPEAQAAYEEYLALRRELGRTGPVTLMDLATVNAKYLKSRGMLDRLDESEEVNACTVKIDVEVDGKKEEWLLFFKNETHNHPTEIEPFGGAATCIGGAIRDPLSGRAYVYAAMRLSGAGDPLRPLEETIRGKLPQRKLVRTAAAGHSSYANQIGVPAGRVDEWYHPGFVAKRLEAGAVIGAAPAANVVRKDPLPGDVVLLVGGRTGRDGCGGATGSSKSHSVESLETCGAEVQRGNAPEERKIQRLFLNGEAARLIKRCNDFGAGGVSVAVGELADGLSVDLNAVPKKYEGLDGTELAISESQERMAVVVDPADQEQFCRLAAEENLEVTPIARVTGEARLVMFWNGRRIVDIDRGFLNTNGAPKKAEARVEAPEPYGKDVNEDFAGSFRALVRDLNVCTKKGMAELFDASVGAGMVLAPLGGISKRTPTQAMVQKVFDPMRDVTTCSLMAWGYNPYISERNPYHGAYLAVVESVAKLIAAGADFKEIYLSFQEYFEKLEKEPSRWGKPLASLLGAFRAQKDLDLAAIGGKDSMSGTFEDIHVPPSLISFAVTTESLDRILSPEFKEAGREVYWIRPQLNAEGLPTAGSLKKIFAAISEWGRQGILSAAATPGYGGAAEAVYKMALGNRLGFAFEPECPVAELFGYSYGSFVLETHRPPEAIPEGVRCTKLGRTLSEPTLIRGREKLSVEELAAASEEVLEGIFPCKYPTERPKASVETYAFRASDRVKPSVRVARPKVLIPAFPGTNSEYDSAKAMAAAGADPQIAVIRNLTASDVEESALQFARQLKQANMVFIPGGFSGGDEPDGSGKFITAFFRHPAVQEETEKLLEQRDGLMIGICNGFQALIKLGLLPWGKILPITEDSPTVTFNAIGRHKADIVRTRIASDKSPWLAGTGVGEIYSVPISHGEGRFVCSPGLMRQLAENGQIAAQYVDESGAPTMALPFNPNGSAYAVEAITSPDGRVLGKMGHFERSGNGVFINVPGRYDMKLFESAVSYFK